MDYFDKLKSNTKGYASLDYDFAGYKPSQLVKLDILLSGKPIDALSFIVHKDKAYDRGLRAHRKAEGNHPGARCSRCLSRPPSAGACSLARR